MPSDSDLNDDQILSLSPPEGEPENPECDECKEKDEPVKFGFADLNADFMLPKDFQKIKKLGQGAYGKVMQIIHLPSGREYACKRFEHVFFDDQRARRLLREMKILSSLKHPCCNKLLCVLAPESIQKFYSQSALDGFSSDEDEAFKGPVDFNEVYMVLRLADMDLKKLLKSNKHLEEVQVKSIVYDILCGLKYMHARKIIHRDLKPGNILLNDNCTIQICDYGLARSMDGFYPKEKNFDLNLGHDTDRAGGNQKI